MRKMICALLGVLGVLLVLQCVILPAYAEELEEPPSQIVESYEDTNDVENDEGGDLSLIESIDEYDVEGQILNEELKSAQFTAPTDEKIDVEDTEVVIISQSTSQTENDDTDEHEYAESTGDDLESDTLYYEEPQRASILVQPENISIAQVSPDSIRIVWEEVEGAEYYELYRKIGESGAWSKVKNVYGNIGSNLSLSDGIIYSYKIRAVVTDSGTKIYGLFSEPVSITISSGRVNGLVVERNSLTTVALSWDAVDGATGYELYRSIGSDDSWGKVKTIHTNSASNLNLSTGYTYYYKVRPVFTTQFGTYSGFFSDEVFIRFEDTKPENLNAKKTSSSSVRLEWSRVEGADHYELYREINQTGVWNKVKNISGEVGSNLNLEVGNTYSYKIRAIFVASNKTYAGEFSDSVSISFNNEIPAPVIEDAQQVGLNKVFLKWSAVDIADLYYLYRSDNSGKWTKIKSTEEPSVYNLALSEGVNYQYRVTAVVGQTESAPSNVIEFALGNDFKTIEDLNVTRYSDSRVTLSWSDKTEVIDGYSLFRKVENGSWTKVKNVSGLSTSNMSLESGKVYSYYIRGYKNSELGIYYSLPSNAAIYWNQQITGLYISGSVAVWDEVDGVDKYIVYSDGLEIGTSVTNSYSLSDELIGCTISIVAERQFDGQKIRSIESEGAVYKQPDNAKYRALLIGETAYTTRLNGPDNDMNFMSSMLNGLSNDYDVIAQQNATLDEIIDLIDIAFDGATDDDVSLFYYSGHGVTGAGEYYSGALQTVDYQYLTTGDLAELLSNIPGRVVVILDSCGSGATISDGTESIASVQSAGINMSIMGSQEIDTEKVLEFDPNQFNNGVISAFSSQDSVINSPSSGVRPGGPRKAGELKKTKFYVITGSAYEENSLTTMIDGVWGGVLTRGVAFGTGCSYPGGSYSGSMPADTNSDCGISFSELATYCKNYAGDRQSVLSYSASPNYIIFSR